MPRTLRAGPDSGRLSRLRRFAQNNLGVIMTDDMAATQVFRDPQLDVLDQYYDGTQYDDLMNWETAMASEEYIPVRKRKPRINHRMAKAITDRVTSKLVGQATFPKFTIEDDPDDSAFFKAVQDSCSFRAKLVEPIRKSLIGGSALVRYGLVEGQIIIQGYSGKYCYPVFDDVGNLESVDVKFVYDDWEDIKPNGAPRQKWFRIQLTKTADIFYNNPEYKAGVKPEFVVVNQNNHDLGFVQAEWLKTRDDDFEPDGPGIFSAILDDIDDINYSLSQSSQAISYGQEPQLVINGLVEEELDALTKSSQKGWNLGRDGKAEFLETSLAGVERAEEARGKDRQRMLDVARVVMQDPEKMIGQAQSGRALEILFAPLVELIDELRTVYEPKLRNLLLKIGITILMYEDRGEETDIAIPPGYKPSSLQLSVQWPSLFPPTLQDIQTMVQAANTAAMANLVSRESLTRWLAPVFQIDDIDAELEKISEQPVMNPFGSFGGGFGEPEPEPPANDDKNKTKQPKGKDGKNGKT